MWDPHLRKGEGRRAEVRHVGRHQARPDPGRHPFMSSRSTLAQPRTRAPGSGGPRSAGSARLPQARARPLLVAVCLVAPGLLLPALLLAQSVRGTVTAQETGEPLPTTVVALLDETGSVRAQVLTDARGSFRLQAPTPGSYVLRGERIGRRTAVLPPFDLGPGEDMVRDLVLAVEAISLEGIEVVGDARCRLRPDEGEALARVWERARMVLEAEALGRREEVLRYRLRDYHRILTPDARRVTEETVSPGGGFMREPYRSAPVEEILEDGWVREDPRDGSWEFFAPDAAVLLSEPFQEEHCFRLIRDRNRPGLLGLAFEPLSRRGPPGIEGALWLDESSGELRVLTYRYTRLPPSAGSPRELPSLSEEAMGGRVEFVRLPSGAWVVGRWYIRTPLLHRVTRTVLGRRQEGVELAGVHELGGEVLDVRLPGGDVLNLAARGSVAGVVRDEGEGAPVGGVDLRLEGTAYQARSDTLGRFRFEGIPEGTYRLTARRPGADPARRGSDPVEVEVVADREGAVEVTVSSPAPVAAEPVPGEPRRLAAARDTLRPADVRGPILWVEGRLRDGDDGRPVSDAVITVAETGLEITSGRDGRFVLGELPVGTYQLGIEHVAYGSRTEALRLEEGPVVLLEIALPPRAIALEGFTVTATPRTGADEVRLRSGTRRDIAFGSDLARAEERGERVVDVLRRMPGIEVTEGTEQSELPFGAVCVEMRRATRGIMTGSGCEMVAVILDGSRISGGVEGLGHFLMDLQAADFESVELLGPLQATTLYGMAGSAGAVVLHSRGRGPYRDPARDGDHDPDVR
jgi:hypothetical protein